MTSLIRRASASVLKLIERALDPATVADRVQLYSKDVVGVSQLFAQTDNGGVFQLTIDVTGVGSRWYGSGIDGALVFDGVSTVVGNGFFGLSLAPAAGVYTLTRDIFATDVTIDPGVEVVCGGFRFCAIGTLTLNGSITGNGGAGNVGTATTGGIGGVAAWVSTSAVLFGGVSMGPTFNGGNIGGSGSSGQAPTTTHIGGAVGANTPATNGGILQGGGGGRRVDGLSGGTVTALPTVNQFTNAHHGFVIAQAQAGRNAVGAQLGTGSAGGGGAGGVSASSGGGGGPGASAGNVVVCARFITGVGSIQARGGAGAAAAGVEAGGGGGGAGGIVTVITGFTFPTVDVTGGVGGAAGGAGASTAGGNGGPGRAYLYAIGG